MYKLLIVVDSFEENQGIDRLFQSLGIEFGFAEASNALNAMQATYHSHVLVFGYTEGILSGVHFETWRDLKVHLEPGQKMVRFGWQNLQGDGFHRFPFTAAELREILELPAAAGTQPTEEE